MPDSPALQQAIQAIQAGDTATAQSVLKQLLALEPNNDQAWLWLAACLPDPERQRFCLQKAISIRPDNLQARQALQQLESRLAAEITPAMPAEEEITPQVRNDAPSPAAIPPEDTPPDKGVVPSETAISRAQQKPAGKRAEAPGRAPNGRPASHKKAPAFSPKQFIFLLFLGCVAICAFGGIGILLLQNGMIPPLPFAGAPATPAEVSPIAGPAFSLPPTWTPTPALQASATQPVPEFAAPSPALPTPTPLPSLTPFAQQWRIIPGYSVKNRPVEVFRFGTGKKERMIVAGIHGAYEKNTIALADRLIEYLRQNQDFIPKDTTLYILRSLNPDGEAASDEKEGRLNANRIDLNRNFGVNWKSSWNDKNCTSPSGTAGAAPASEPETQAFIKFLAERKIEVLINYHSAGLGIFPSGSPPQPESQRLAQDIAAISNYSYPPVNSNCEYSGTLIDWAAQNGVIAAVDLELNTHQDTEFEANLKILRLLLDWQPAPRTPTPLTPSPDARTPQATTPAATTTTGTPEAKPQTPSATASPSHTPTPSDTASPSPSTTP